MSIIGIDIGSSTTKIVEYKDNYIINKDIFMNLDVEQILENFVKTHNIKVQKIEKIIITGIGANELRDIQYNVPVEKVEEFNAIGTGGLFLSKKEKAIIASIGTGTALIRAENRKKN